MLISLEEEDELEMLRKDVFEVSEAMLAFPLKLLGTRYHRGVKVIIFLSLSSVSLSCLFEK